MKTIHSRDNPTVRRLHALAGSARERRKYRQTLLDGAHLLAAARQARWPLKELVVSDHGLAQAEIVKLLDDAADVPILHLPDRLFAYVSPVDSPSGVLAVIDLPAPPPVKPLRDTVVLLDGVQDTGNLGTILRTAAAAGVGDVLLTRGCAQAWSPRVLRAGMGAHFVLRVHEAVDVGARLAGFCGPRIATALTAGARSLYEVDLTGPVAWLFGAEGQGLSPEVTALASLTVTIPMQGMIESLNVGAAAAVCLFEQLRQQRCR
ncbi:rRNA methyltransferase [Rhodocyclaceae bacterium]|nr:rRNA methyltransferase [Rhodocyclaceae bacterium]